MSWRRKEPGHQQPWYWPSYNEVTRCPHVKGSMGFWMMRKSPTGISEPTDGIHPADARHHRNPKGGPGDEGWHYRQSAATRGGFGNTYWWPRAAGKARVSGDSRRADGVIGQVDDKVVSLNNDHLEVLPKLVLEDVEAVHRVGKARQASQEASTVPEEWNTHQKASKLLLKLYQ